MKFLRQGGFDKMKIQTPHHCFNTMKFSGTMEK